MYSVYMIFTQLTCEVERRLLKASRTAAPFSVPPINSMSTLLSSATLPSGIATLKLFLSTSIFGPTLV
jgi:hypothetical protein